MPASVAILPPRFSRRPGMSLLLLWGQLNVPRAAPDQTRVRAPVLPLLSPPGFPGRTTATHWGGGRSKAEEPRCLGPFVQRVLWVAWCRGQAGLGSGSSLGQPCGGEPALPMSPTVTPALGRSTGTPVSKQQVISTLPRSTGLSHLWLVTQLGHAPHVSRHLNDLPSCAQTAVQVCSTPHASLRPRAGWAQAELRRPHNPTPKPGLLPAK